MSISAMSYGADNEFETSTSSEDFIASEWAVSGIVLLCLGVLASEDETLES